MEHLPLTALDRCDRCGAQAYARTVHRDGASTLLWCAHHLHQHSDILTPCLVTYEVDRLRETVKVGA